MAKVFDCIREVSEFELQSRKYVYFRVNTFGKSMNPLLFFHNDGFGIQWPMNVDIKQWSQT